MTKDKALKLALEALIGQGYYDTTQQREAIAAIKEALAQPEEDFCYCDDSISLQIVSGGAAVGGLYYRVKLKIDGEYVNYVKEQPEQEPDLTDADHKSYQEGHNAGVAHHKQAVGERVLIGWTPQELRQIKGMAHETQDVYRAMQAKIYEYERILREKNKEIAALNKTQLDQALERNFCSRCGKRLMGPLGPVSIHTCTPPNARTFDDYGNKIL